MEMVQLTNTTLQSLIYSFVYKRYVPIFKIKWQACRSWQSLRGLQRHACHFRRVNPRSHSRGLWQFWLARTDRVAKLRLVFHSPMHPIALYRYILTRNRWVGSLIVFLQWSRVDGGDNRVVQYTYHRQKHRQRRQYPNCGNRQQDVCKSKQYTPTILWTAYEECFPSTMSNGSDN